MQLTHEFRGFDVDRVFIFELALNPTKNEREGLDMLRQVVKPEFPFLTFFEVVEFKSLEIAEQNEALQVLVVLDAG